VNSDVGSAAGARSAGMQPDLAVLAVPTDERVWVPQAPDVWFRPLLLLVVVMAGQAALHFGFKWFFERPRPSALINYPNAENFSLPSGHAIGAVCLYGAIAWAVATRAESSAAKAGIAIFAAVMIFLIGVSRIYIGVHYPTDVLAGFIAASIWTAAGVSLDRRPL